MKSIGFSKGNYRYIPAVFQYSAGVCAEDGHEIERVRFAHPVPLETAFAMVEAHLTKIGRPLTALAACELRTPAPFDEAGLVAFNRKYVATLERWGIYLDGVNPVARTNVCPEYNKPPGASMVAFSFTVPAPMSNAKTFVLAGAGEWRQGTGSSSADIVRFGDTSAEGMREKVLTVIGEMERRLAALGLAWSDALVTQAYSVHDIGNVVGNELARRGVMEAGLLWHFARPPAAGLDFEMDVRALARESILHA